MRWSFRLGRVMGIDVKVHATFLLLLAFFGFAFHAQGGMPAAIQGVSYILLLFACVLLHEFGHALAAKAYGIRTADITLLPIGGVARLERMPEEPFQEFVVAAAGPLVNVVIVLGLLIVKGGRGDFSSLAQLDSPGTDLVTRLLITNVLLVLFNLLPAFPMDGGRILRSILAARMNHARATQIAANVGQVMAFGLGFLGLFGNPMLIFIAVFVYMGAAQEAAVAQMKDVAVGMSVSEAMVRDFHTLPEHASLGDAVDALLRTSQHDFPVTDLSGGVAGVLTRRDLLAALRSSGVETPVSQVMRRGVPTVVATARFDEAFRLMNECDCPALPVLGSDGQLVGLFTPENVGEMMMVHAAMARNRRRVPPPPT